MTEKPETTRKFRFWGIICTYTVEPLIYLKYVLHADIIIWALMAFVPDCIFVHLVDKRTKTTWIISSLPFCIYSLAILIYTIVLRYHFMKWWKSAALATRLNVWNNSRFWFLIFSIVFDISAICLASIAEVIYEMPIDKHKTILLSNGEFWIVISLLCLWLILFLYQLHFYNTIKQTIYF